MAHTALALAHPDEPIEYPESDGQPMAETDRHRKELSETIRTLERQFRAREDVYVSGNLFFYYEEGNPNACKAPDVFVVTGVPKKERRTYKLWEEGEVPTLVIEMTSKKTKREDEEEKPKLYAELGIPYFFLFDPYGEYLKPSFQGFELRDGKYHRIPGPTQGPLPCPPLGLDLFVDEAGRLRFLDAETGDPVPRESEALDRAEAALVGAEAARAQEKMARLEAERERRELEESNRQMTAEIERLRARRQGG